MKPERLNGLERLFERARSCAGKVRELFDWIKAVAGALKDVFGLGIDDRNSP